MEATIVEAQNFKIKKQNSKIQSTTSIDQLKFNKNEDFYKAKYYESEHLHSKNFIYGIW